MIRPSLVLSAVVSTLRDISSLMSELDNDSSLIIPFGYVAGEDNSLVRAIEQMPDGSILVAHLDLLGGAAAGFNGAEIWKHRFEVYLRPNSLGVSPLDLWWLAMNGVVTSTGRSIRAMSLIPPSINLPETPSIAHQQDAMGMDFWVGSIIWPEQGDD